MDIISRKDAKAQGLARYFTGKPCIRGHVVERQTSSSDCIICLRARQSAWDVANADKNNARAAIWYAKNVEKAKETRKAWRSRNAEKDRADVAAYQASHKEELKSAGKKWQIENLDKGREKSARFRKNNLEKSREIDRQWAARNKPKVNACKARRIARKLRAIPTWANAAAIETFYELARDLSATTGIQHHVDHIVPLQSKSVCGLHCEANLRVIPGNENLSKGNRHWPDMPACLGAS